MSEDTEKLEEKANQPKSVTVDGQTVNNHSLAAQIELDKYRQSRSGMDTPFDFLRMKRVRH